jgi:hypothetical protein
MKVLGDSLEGREPMPAVHPPGRFRALRRRLIARHIDRIQWVYCVLAESPQVTLCAVPTDPAAVVSMSPRLRDRLLRAFCTWMHSHEPGWLSGPDCAGVLLWELTRNEWSHRHCGYIQQYVSRTHGTPLSGGEGIPPAVQRMTSPQRPAMP